MEEKGSMLETIIVKLLSANTISDFLEVWLQNDLLPPAEQKTMDNYYRSYKTRFGSYIKRNYCEQTGELMNVLSKLKSPKILEVGSGCGTESLWLSLHGAKVIGIDIDDHLLSAAKSRKELLETYIKTFLPCTFITKSLLDMDSKEKFDIIWIEQAFHHLEPRKLMFDKIAELLNKDGYIIISETNAWNPLIQLLLFRLRGFTTIIEHNGHAWGHERILRSITLKKEFIKRGITTVSVRYFRILPNLPIANKIGFIDKMVPKFCLPLFTHYNYVGKNNQ